MDVLQDAEAVVRHLDAEILGVAGVPGLGQVGRGDLAPDQLLLQLEADDHVQPVRDLVGVDPDERRLDAVDGAVEVLCGDLPEDVGESRLQLGVEPPPEGRRAPDDVLPQTALRLVQARGDAAAERCPLERRVDAVLVEAVPALVHRGEERVKVALRVTGGQPDVRGCEAGAERVHRAVEPEVLPRGAEALDHVAREALLLGLRERPAHECRLLGRPDLCRQPDQLGLDPVEHRACLGRRHAGLVVVEEDVVLLRGGLEAVEVAAAELEVPVEPGRERRVVALRPGSRPRLLGVGRDACDLGGQLGRDTAGLVPVAPRDPDQARIVGLAVERFLERPQLLEQPSDLGIDETLVGEAVERGELLGPDRAATVRHHHELVPLERERDLVQVVQLVQAASELCECGVHGAFALLLKRTQESLL